MKEVFRDIFPWLKVAIIKAGWFPIAVFGFHQLVARGFDAYNVFPLLDIPMHFLGGVAIGVFFWVLFTSNESLRVIGGLTQFGRIIVSIMGVFVAVSMWEFAEWTTDFIGISEAQLSINDTMLDMFLGVCGGVLAVICFNHFLNKKSRNS